MCVMNLHLEFLLTQIRTRFDVLDGMVPYIVHVLGNVHMLLHAPLSTVIHEPDLGVPVPQNRPRTLIRSHNLLRMPSFATAAIS